MVKRIIASGNIDGVDYNYIYNTNDFGYYFEYYDTYKPYVLNFAGLSDFQDTGLETNVVFDVNFIDLDGLSKTYIILGDNYKDVVNYVSMNLGKVIKVNKSDLQITNI